MSLTTDMMDGDRFTAEQIASRELLRMMVARTIFCPVSGALLDNRTAVLLEAEHPTMTILSRVVAPEVWADKETEVRDAMATMGATLTVTEGAA